MQVSNILFLRGRCGKVTNLHHMVWTVDFEWSDVNAIDKMTAVVADFGRATAMMHGAADKDSEHAGLVDFSTEEAIDAAIAKDEAGFEKLMLDFGHQYSAKVRKDHQLFVDMFRNGKIPGLGGGNDG